MAKIKYNTIDEFGRQTNSQGQRLAQLPDDFEIERDILEARQNKKARQDAGMDMLLDAVKKKTKPKKGKV